MSDAPPIADPGHYPYVVTKVAASYGVSFGISIGPIGKDFAITNRSTTTVTVRADPGPVYGINLTGTCEGQVSSCTWVQPDS
ncbi:MAG: hypothetical protein JO079_01485 [Frankiaceae bacterium]|nr:hypothetical protein [Frankiaceae bacterium]MBV9368612.1 hypothetical protein [Frankiales bacterium]